jgi:hypothetical protein
MDPIKEPEPSWTWPMTAAFVALLVFFAFIGWLWFG